MMFAYESRDLKMDVVSHRQLSHAQKTQNSLGFAERSGVFLHLMTS